jgi:UrcA family protein
VGALCWRHGAGGAADKEPQAMLRYLAPSLLAAALATSAAAAPAAPAGDRVSIAVRVADLDIQSDAGARIALQRIRKAAREICGEEPDIRDLARQPLVKACMRDTVNAAVASADSPALTTLAGTPMRVTTLAAAH